MAELSRRWSGMDSTSVTYERAEQFMEAVCYCIREAEEADGELPAKLKRPSAKEAYERGLKRVMGKVQIARRRYHKLLPDFRGFKNRCLEETFYQGIPAFFQWYDVRFEPQNTILTLDYPILQDRTADSGIERILGYLNDLRLEQQFLLPLDLVSVQRFLKETRPGWEEQIENVCQVVLLELLCSALARKKFASCWQEAEFERLTVLFSPLSEKETEACLRRLTEELVIRQYAGDSELLAYLLLAASDAAVCLGMAVRQNTLSVLLNGSRGMTSDKTSAMIEGK